MPASLELAGMSEQQKTKERLTLASLSFCYHSLQAYAKSKFVNWWLCVRDPFESIDESPLSTLGEVALNWPQICIYNWWIQSVLPPGSAGHSIQYFR